MTLINCFVTIILSLFSIQMIKKYMYRHSNHFTADQWNSPVTTIMKHFIHVERIYADSHAWNIMSKHSFIDASQKVMCNLFLTKKIIAWL